MRKPPLLRNRTPNTQVTKVDLGSLPAALIVIDAIAGAVLAFLGCWAFGRARRRRAAKPS